ncbi:MAG TPA: S8 family serine peptidase, partial [Hyphomicrobium sp.]|nr:S8 family serine peptidase [Hyphomicrobium sp.]
MPTFKFGRRVLASVLLTGSTWASAQAQTVDAEFDAQWGLAAIGAQYALERGITGAGVRVGVVDGIFQTSHPEFAGRVDPFQFNPNNLGPDAHGTHVAGIIGAARNGIGMEGVAPGVSLAPMWAFAADDDLAAAYLNAVSSGIKVFNNSWGLAVERDITTQTQADAISAIGAPLIEALYSTL